MVDAGTPEQDGFGHLFGSSDNADAFNWAVTPPATPAAPPAAGSPSGSLPSRRDLRAAAPAGRTASAGRKASEGRTVSAARTKQAVASSTRRQPRRARASKGAPQPFVKPIDSAYPVNRVIVVRRAAPAAPKMKFGRKVLTVAAVVGLLGSAVAPAAMAFTQNSEEAPVSLSAAAPSSVEALKVSQNAVLADSARGGYNATSANDLAEQRSNQWKSANYAAYMKSGAREQGDDYPYFSELSVAQGGGLSPFNYFYRECVDFVAWRLNRDAGSTSAPYKWVWSNLTPTGGNASQWKYAWQAHGWKTSTKPVQGAVAWFYGNHVGYVNTVNGDGTIVLEDYNHEGTRLYSKRTIPISDVALFLYPPPANG
jgi:surface antigen